LFRVPPDAIGHEVARTLSAPGPARERLTRGAYVPKSEAEAVGALEAALIAVIAAEPAEAKLHAAARAGKLAEREDDARIDAAVRLGAISESEAQLVRRARALRRKVIAVDDFPRDLGRSEMHQTTEPVSFASLRHAFDEARDAAAS
jgi:acyl-CoA dehydrogenase